MRKHMILLSVILLGLQIHFDMQSTTTATSPSTTSTVNLPSPTVIPPIVQENAITNIYIQPGQEQNLHDIVFSIWQNSPISMGLQVGSSFTDTSLADLTTHVLAKKWTNSIASNYATDPDNAQRVFHLMQSVGGVDPVNSTIQGTLQSLGSTDFKNGIYIVPYYLDHQGYLIKNTSKFSAAPYGQVCMAIFDSNWNLKGNAKGAISSMSASSVSVHNINFSPAATTLRLLDSSNQESLTHDTYTNHIAYGNTAFRIQTVSDTSQVPPSSLNGVTQQQQDKFHIDAQPTQIVPIGAVGVPAGTITEFAFNITIGQSTTPIDCAIQKQSISNMQTLNALIEKGSMTFEVLLQPNASNTAMNDCIVNGYQGMSTTPVLTQLFPEVSKVSDGPMTALGLSYKTEGMISTSPVQDLGSVDRCVVVQTGNSAATGMVIGGQEQVTLINVGFLFRMGYVQYSSIIPVAASSVSLINTSLAAGQNVTLYAKTQPGSTNIGAVISAEAGGQVLFTDPVSELTVTNMSTKQTGNLPNNATLVSESIGFQTTNMSQGVMIPSVSKYTFVTNNNAYYVNLDGLVAPTITGGGSTNITPPPGGSPGGGHRRSRRHHS